MLSWNPTNAEIWFVHSESDVDVHERITVTGEVEAGGSPPPELTWVLTPDDLPPQARIYAEEGVLHFVGPTLTGIFPILALKYVMPDNTVGDVRDFDDVPDPADHIFEYRKEPDSPRIYNLEITATSSGTVDETGDSGTVGTTETRTYEFHIEADYTPGRDRLIEEVQKRQGR